MKTVLLAMGIVAAQLPAGSPVVEVQGADCFAVGQAKAQELGGTLSSADDAVQNGAKVCRIVIVVPARDGARPKRVEMIVPNA